MSFLEESALCEAGEEVEHPASYIYVEAALVIHDSKRLAYICKICPSTLLNICLFLWSNQLIIAINTIHDSQKPVIKAIYR